MQQPLKDAIYDFSSLAHAHLTKVCFLIAAVSLCVEKGCCSQSVCKERLLQSVCVWRKVAAVSLFVKKGYCSQSVCGERLLQSVCV